LDCAGITGELMSSATTGGGAGVNAGIDRVGLPLRTALVTICSAFLIGAGLIGAGFARRDSAPACAGLSEDATGRSGKVGTALTGVVAAGSALAGAAGSAAGGACVTDGSGVATWAKAGVAVMASTAAIAVRPG